MGSSLTAGLEHGLPEGPDHGPGESLKILQTLRSIGLAAGEHVEDHDQDRVSNCLKACCHSLLGPGGAMLSWRGGEVEEPCWFGQVEGVQDAQLVAAQG